MYLLYMGNKVSKKGYTIEEFNKHKSLKSLWILSGSKIYDITIYISIHPGGLNSIFKNMNNQNYIIFKNHSKSAQKIWDKYYIGRLIK